MVSGTHMYSHESWREARLAGGVENCTVGRVEKAAELEAHVVDSAPVALPPYQVEPTPTRPFIFFHLDKCGGSTAR